MTVQLRVSYSDNVYPSCPARQKKERGGEYMSRPSAIELLLTQADPIFYNGKAA